MTKTKKRYVCIECGYTTLSYLGRCPECKNWDTLKEEIPKKGTERQGFSLNLNLARPLPINKINIDNIHRIKTGINELDRVLGGGIVEGSLVLIGGEPGIGKSTLLLQMTDAIAKSGKKVLYVSGEESQSQIKLRAERLNVTSQNVIVFTENNIESIETELQELKPDIIIVDSIQTVVIPEINTVPGTLIQVRECAARFLKISKGMGIPTFIIGHVTKEGVIAGPRVLEHMVDTVLYFEGETKGMIRILRAVKNRFGSTDEIGVFEMTGRGLIEIKNPSQIFISKNLTKSPGVATAVTLEGTRPLLVEIEGLVCYSPFPQPRRLSTGIDYNRMAICIAVIEKKAGIRLSGQDIYINVSGGIRLNDTACDLATCFALYSSYKEISLAGDLCFIGEVSLTGEVRGVIGIESRIKEATRNGFKRIIIPEISQKLNFTDIKLFPVTSIRDAVAALNKL
ncbi:MAG: DNA repair protein RadA [Candidatus Hydrogenedentota bacterium]